MQDNNQPNNQHEISIELGPVEAEGIYSNLAIISHSSAEFVMDFTRILPGAPKARVQARIIMTPQHAKLLLNALNENIKKFELENGDIKLDRNNQIFPGFPGNPTVN